VRRNRCSASSRSPSHLHERNLEAKMFAALLAVEKYERVARIENNPNKGQSVRMVFEIRSHGFLRATSSQSGSSYFMSSLFAHIKKKSGSIHVWLMMSAITRGSALPKRPCQNSCFFASTSEILRGELVPPLERHFR
jgi:hypothetical protein